MRGDYSGKADDKHFRRILGMQDRMLNLLVKKRTYDDCARNKNAGSDIKSDAKVYKDKMENEIDELREEMRQQ